ncbi:FMRFamide receptor-like [Mizuhopecten yessoensis]|uniref:FMRFamide receptor-like n=1 Tax=Mizuhopecten yessoensis TaxID=6573 RepID=UPI000B45C204|nr:FMRFamide receptor-like [Mizuhopecten yessoensis]
MTAILTNITTLISTVMTTEMTSTNTLTAGDYEKIFFRIKLWKICHGYIMFILIILGVAANILAFIILSQKSVRRTTIAVYLRALSLADTFVLITAFFRYNTYKLFLTEAQDTYSVLHFSAYLDAYIKPFHWISLGVSSFVTLTLSIERFLAIRYPLTIKRSCTPFLVRVCIVGIIVIVVILTSPIFFSFRVKEFSYTNTSSVYVQVMTRLGRDTLYPCTYHIYVIPLLWYILPWILLAILNLLLYLQVRRSSRIRVGLPNIPNPNRNLSILILLIVIIYMVCNLPISIMVFYKLVNHMSENGQCIQETTSLTSTTSKEFDIINAITEILNILNSCLNIVVYCMVGTKFRRQLRDFLLCTTCKPVNKVSPQKVFTTGRESNTVVESAGSS